MGINPVSLYYKELMGVEVMAEEKGKNNF